MRALTCLSLLLLSLLPLPAQAVVQGREARSPNGLRQSVVWLENSEGELCSAALIRPDLVLTAAHCMLDVASYRVVGFNRAFKKQIFEVSAFAPHPAFVPGTTPRTQPGVDLALLKLARPVGPDFMPFNLNLVGQVDTGDRVTLAGYGLATENQKRSARVLRQIDLVSLGNIHITNRVMIVADERRLAQTTGAGACRGDSGGPVLLETRQGPQLLGIVSWSSGALRSSKSSACGGLTAVTPVAEHMTWITQSIRMLDGIQGEWARQ